MLVFNNGCIENGFKLTAKAIALKSSAQQGDNTQLDLPEFEIADDTYVETRESKSRLEREMTLKAFTEPF